MMMSRYKDLEVFNNTCNGKCSCCGECCGDILHLSHEEIKRIDDYLKKHKVKETKRNILVDYDNTCPFRDNEKMICKIYDVRPDICKVYMCNKTARECFMNRELTNEGKLPRSMRNLFYNDNKGAIFMKNNFLLPIFDRKDRVIDE